jgi:tetratricopeptide (TPR) repeat protein
MKNKILTILVSVFYLTTFGQNPPTEFFKGLDLLSVDKQQARKQFLLANKKDSLFHGTYHFLGVLYLDENQPDSAITCFQKSIYLNSGNINHTKEMTYVRLINAYLFQYDFNNSFSIAWEAYQQYPENQIIQRELEDVCLWSFYIRHNNLDSTYLSSSMKDEYIVNSIPEEYLIVRKIRVEEEPLVFKSQGLHSKKGVNYDIITCNLSKSQKDVDIKFKLNWDLNKDFGGKVVDTDEVYNNVENQIFERVGARLISDTDINLQKVINKLMKNMKK